MAENNEIPDRSSLAITGSTLIRVRMKQHELAARFNYAAPSQDTLINMAFDALDRFGIIAPEKYGVQVEA